MTQKKWSWIYFEAQSPEGMQGYAVLASTLDGVASLCPRTSYDGLPKGVSGIVQWSGKIFPLLRVAQFLPGAQSVAELNKTQSSSKNYLFYRSQHGPGIFHEIAFEINSSVEVVMSGDVEGLQNSLPWIRGKVNLPNKKPALILDFGFLMRAFNQKMDKLSKAA